MSHLQNIKNKLFCFSEFLRFPTTIPYFHHQDENQVSVRRNIHLVIFPLPFSAYVDFKLWSYSGYLCPWLRGKLCWSSSHQNIPWNCPSRTQFRLPHVRGKSGLTMKQSKFLLESSFNYAHSRVTLSPALSRWQTD